MWPPLLMTAQMTCRGEAYPLNAVSFHNAYIFSIFSIEKEKD